MAKQQKSGSSGTMFETGLELPVDRPARMVIIHPKTRRPILEAGAEAEGAEPAWIELYSSDSAAALAFEREQYQKLIDLRQQAGRAPLSAQQSAEFEAARLAAVTCGWRIIDLAGRVRGDLACTLENRRAFYLAPALAWVREQVQAFQADRANFA